MSQLHLLSHSAERDKQHFEDQAKSTVNETLTNFIKLEKPLIPPLIFPFTIQRLVGDDFFL